MDDIDALPPSTTPPLTPDRPSQPRTSGHDTANAPDATDAVLTPPMRSLTMPSALLERPAAGPVPAFTPTPAPAPALALAPADAPVHTDPDTSYGSLSHHDVPELPEPVEELSIGKRFATISRADVRKDPILSRLAESQGNKIWPLLPDKPVTPFKSRPAPTMTASGRAGAVGPRLSKAAALRMGVWTPGVKNKPAGGQVGKDVDKDKGTMKTRPSMNIASLANPTVAPRQNRSALLRTGSATPTAAAPRKTPEVILAEKKARAEAEREKRRQSVVLPPSLSAPTIVPRMNKTAAMRTAPAAGTMGPPGLPASAMKRVSALLSTTANNVPPAVDNGGTAGPKGVVAAGAAPAGGLQRRATTGTLKSLGAPSITPRLNKTALLRTGTGTTATATGTATAATTTAAHTLTRTVSRPSLLTRPTQSSIARSVTKASVAESGGAHAMTAPRRAPKIEGQGEGAPADAPADADAQPRPGPKPTRASLLRAGMGARVSSAR